MVFIKWNEQYSVGIEEIDNQHKGLVKLINKLITKLFDAMSEGQANNILGEIINDMARYTQVHFATEEKYFARFRYAESDTHIKEHLKFIEEVIKFRTQFEAGNIVLSIEIFRFLKNWLVNHILVYDKKYSQYFIANGLK
jgi:hemerythrin